MSFASVSPAGKSEAAAEFTSLVATLCGQVADTAWSETEVEQDAKSNQQPPKQTTTTPGTVLTEQPTLTTTYWVLPKTDAQVIDGLVVVEQSTGIEDAEDTEQPSETSPHEWAVFDTLLAPILPDVVFVDAGNWQQYTPTEVVPEGDPPTSSAPSLPLPIKGNLKGNPAPESAISSTVKQVPAPPTRSETAPAINDSPKEAEVERFNAFGIQLRTGSVPRTTSESENHEVAAVRPPISGKGSETEIRAPQQDAPQTGQDGQEQSSREQGRASSSLPGREVAKPGEPSTAPAPAPLKTTGENPKAEPQVTPTQAHVVPQHDRTSSDTPVNAISSERPTAATTAMDTIQRIEALRLGGVTMPRPQTMHDLEIRIPSLGAPVDVKLSDRGGNVEISVRSADPLLAQQLHAQLPELIETLETRGYEASALLHHDNRPEIVTAQLSRSAYENSENESSRRQDQQQQQNSRQRGRNRRNDGQTQFHIEENQITTSIL